MKSPALRLLLTTILSAFFIVPLHAADGWMDNFQDALARAKVQKKLLFMRFAASDWSPESKKQAAEVFAQPEFKDYAAPRFVLLGLDYPKTAEIKKETSEQNSELRARFGVRTFPTMIVLDGDGNELGRWVGYAGGGAARTIAKLEAFKQE